MQKITDNLLKIFIFCFIFVSQLLFLTKFSKDPFMVQSLISIIAIFSAMLILIFKFKNQKTPSFFLAKPDIAVLIFLVIAGFSFLVNIARGEYPLALIKYFSVRGYTLVTAIFGGYFLARLLCNNTAFLSEQTEGSKNYKNGFLFLLWGVLWIPFSYFRTTGLFDIYCLLMWGPAFYIALRFLKQINLRNILDILLITSTLAAAYGICQSLHYDFLWGFDFSKPFGSIGVSTFGNPNFLSSFLLLTLPLSITFYLSSQIKAEKIYYFTLNLVCLAFIAISQTRSAWIGLFAICLILISSKYFRELLLNNKTKISILIAGLAVFLIIWPANKTSVDKISDIKIASENIFKNPKNLTLAADRKALNVAYHQRLMGWTCGIENLKDNPLLGTGWGSWQLNYASCQGKLLNKYPSLQAQDFRVQSNSAHNIFIETLSQSGFLGFVPYLVFLSLVVFGFIKCYSQGDTKKNLLFFVIFAACLGFLTDSLLNVSFQIQVVCSVFYFFVGIVVSLNAKRRINLSEISVKLLFVLMLILLCFFSMKRFNDLLASHYSLKGYFAMKGNNYIQADEFFDKSLKISTEEPETSFVYIEVLENLKKYEDLNALLFETLDYFPEYYEFYNLRANFEIKLNKAEDAFSHIKKSLALNPRYEGTFKLILISFTNFKELRNLENAQFLESLKPPLSYQNVFSLLLWQIYFEQGQYDKAREILLTELFRNKFDQNIQEKLIITNEKLKINKDPILENAQNLSALRTRLMEAKEVSSSLLKKLEEVASNGDMDARMLVAQAYFKRQDFYNCRLILEELYKINSDYLPLNFALASLEEVQGNKEKAKKYLQGILFLDKTNKLASRRIESLN